MNPNRSPLLIVLLIVITALLIGCAGPEGIEGPVGPAGATGPMGPAGPPGVDATASQEFVGSDRCGECHEDAYGKFILTGHANDLIKVESAPPVYPYDDVTGGVPEPPEGYAWSDISYVVGGFNWKAIFLNSAGYVITGEAAQYNFANDVLETDADWVAYHTGEENETADCGQCHTTGYRPTGHQDELAGIVGTWEFEGVQCENCHGPGSRHAEDPYGVHMVSDRSSQLCGECHSRGNPALIQASDGFELHNQQFNDLYNSKHFAISCVTCHDPHASALYGDEVVNPTQGISQVCEACHWPNLYQNNAKHFSVDCTDCHMPLLALSAQGDLDLFTGDIRAHQFSINPDPEAPQFNEDGSQVMPYLTLEYACQQCHNSENGSVRDLAELSEMADGYHDPLPPTPTPEPEPEPEPIATPEA